MSYFERINQNYWIFKDAANEYIENNGGNKEKGLAQMSTDLSLKKTKTAKTWRQHWKAMVAEYNKQTNEQSTQNNTASSSTPTVINTANGQFDHGSQQNNNFNGTTIIQNDKEGEEYVSISKSDSFSSNDDMPKRTTKLVLEMNINKDENKELDKEAQWIKDKFNLSYYLLHQYKTKSIKYNELKQHKELSLARRFSMHHIFFFPLNKEESCIGYLDSDLINKLYIDIYASIPNPVIHSDVSVWAEEVFEASQTGGEFELDLLFSNYLKTAVEEKCEIRRSAAYILMELVHLLGQNPSHQHPNAEDTFVHNYLSPFLKRMLYGPKLQAYWSNTQLDYSSLPAAPATSTSVESVSTSSESSPPIENESSLSSAASTSTATSTSAKRKYEDKTFRPDFTLYTSLFGHRYDLFVVEVKPPKSTMAVYDFPKMCKEMKYMLDTLVNVGVESPSVCGLWVDGYYCKTYKLEIPYDGIYRMIQLGEFELPRSINDTSKLKYTMKNLTKMKEIINDCSKKIEVAIKWKKDHLEEIATQINFQNVPSPSWLRDSAGKERRVKKTKRND